MEGTVTPLPNNEALCEECSNEMLDKPARSEQESSKGSGGTKEWW